MPAPPRTSKKKLWKRKPRMRRRADRTTNINRAVQPIANKYICRHKYASTLTLQSSNNYAYQFNLNSTYDPDRSGGGHQPYGRDTLATLYNRYRVFGVTYAISFFNPSGSAKLAVMATNQTLSPNNVSEVIENPQTKWAIQLPGGSQKVIKGYVNLPKLAGLTKAQYMADDRYQAQIDANPAETLLLNLYGAAINDVGTDVYVAISMTYHVEWFDRIPLAQS